MKYGKVKRQHGRLKGLDQLTKIIADGCEDVSRIVPGRIKMRKGAGPAVLKIQYPTPMGLKLLYLCSGTVQEVFLTCSDPERVKSWLLEQGLC